MATYAIGDIQGCLIPLQKLLEKIAFNTQRDKLWFTGDLVNRGPHSLETLRFIKNLGDSAQIVLGNHDLHLLARAYDAHPGWDEDTLGTILAAPDRDDLINWLRQQPLIHHDKELGFAMVHASLAASWDLATALRLGAEVSEFLCAAHPNLFLQNMYGNYPGHWSDELSGWDRLRCITNYFTRARFCFANGDMELTLKENVTEKPENLEPWFAVSDRLSSQLKIIFGHWAALGGVTDTENVFAMDTGCVWGYCLTAMRLEDGERISVECEDS
jgi:bis(5'-nucleosyl)-tetraphosphatase (symmetrical)